MFTKTFWAAAGERAVKSAAQTLLLLFGGDGLNLLQLDWPTVLGLAAGAAVLSVLTSMVSAAAPVGAPGSPSLTVETVDDHVPRHAADD